MDDVQKRVDDARDSAEETLNQTHQDADFEAEEAQSEITSAKENARRDWDSAYSDVEPGTDDVTSDFDGNVTNDFDGGATDDLEGDARRMKNDLDGSTDSIDQQAGIFSGGTGVHVEEPADDLHAEANAPVMSPAESLDDPVEEDEGETKSFIDRVKQVFEGN